MKNKKTILYIIILVLALILIITTAIIILNNRKPKQIVEEGINEEQLELSFDDMFNNEENEYVKTQYFIQDEKAGKFKMDAHIPYIDIEGEAIANINNEIKSIFTNKLIKIGLESDIYTIFKMDYCTEVNNNVLSIVIKCILKEGNNPQRTIIKTYNYDLIEEKLLNITDIIPEEKNEEIQNKITQKIENKIKKEEAIIEQGYNIYRRNLESDIYLLENAKEFYLSKENIVYIIYSYGNNNYTSETDLIITKI